MQKSKLILRKKDLRTIGQSKDITSASATAIVEIDLTFNGLE